MDTEGLINTSPLVFRNIILQSNQFKKLDLVDKETGEIINTINYNSRCRTTPIYFKERVIVGIDKSEVLCYSFVEEE